MDKPEETDQALLASLPLSVARSLASKSRQVIDLVYGFDMQFTHYELGECPVDDQRAALALVERALAGSEPREAISELARLRLLVKVRAEDATDIELMAAAYADEMAAYPPDAVRHVLRSWARREKWWPAWAELKKELDRAVRKRKALHRALVSGLRQSA